jgi:hypothetical protein
MYPVSGVSHDNNLCTIYNGPYPVIVQKRINDCRDSGMSVLNLSGIALGKIAHLKDLWETIANLKIADVNLSNTGLTDAPAALAKSMSIETIDLRNNKLTSIPASYLDMPKLRQVMVTGNPLKSFPPQLMERLDCYETARDLHDAIKKWWPAAGGWSRNPHKNARSGDLNDWLRFATLESAPGFTLWLKKLEEYLTHKEFNSPNAKEHCYYTVLNLLQDICNREVDDPCVIGRFDIAHEGSSSCVDRAALALDDMEIERQIAETAKQPDGARQLLKLGVSCHRLHLADMIAIRHVHELLREKGRVDEIEVILAVRVKLRSEHKELNLPGVIDTMWFWGVSGVNQGFVKMARYEILSEQIKNGREAVLDYLASWEPWRQYLRINDKIRTKLESAEKAASDASMRLMDSMTTMKDSDCKVEYDTICRQREETIQSIYREATREEPEWQAFMKADAPELSNPSAYSDDIPKEIISAAEYFICGNVFLDIVSSTTDHSRWKIVDLQKIVDFGKKTVENLCDQTQNMQCAVMDIFCGLLRDMTHDSELRAKILECIRGDPGSEAENLFELHRVLLVRCRETALREDIAEDLLRVWQEERRLQLLSGQAEMYASRLDEERSNWIDEHPSCDSPDYYAPDSGDERLAAQAYFFALPTAGAGLPQCVISGFDNKSAVGDPELPTLTKKEKLDAAKDIADHERSDRFVQDFANWQYWQDYMLRWRSGGGSSDGSPPDTNQCLEEAKRLVEAAREAGWLGKMPTIDATS